MFSVDHGDNLRPENNITSWFRAKGSESKPQSFELKDYDVTFPHVGMMLALHGFR